MIDPNYLEGSEETLEYLNHIAALAGHFYSVLRTQVPDVVAQQMVIDWHSEVISPDVEWNDLGPNPD